MVTARDIADLADHLFQLQTETADRSAASRAYYAAFWHARKVVEENVGTLESAGPEVHSEVGRLLQLWNPDAADALDDLRKSRNLADYDEAGTFGRGRASDSVLIVRWILSNT